MPTITVKLLDLQRVGFVHDIVVCHTCRLVDIYPVRVAEDRVIGCLNAVGVERVGLSQEQEKVSDRLVLRQGLGGDGPIRTVLVDALHPLAPCADIESDGPDGSLGTEAHSTLAELIASDHRVGLYPL